MTPRMGDHGLEYHCIYSNELWKEFSCFGGYSIEKETIYGDAFG